MRRVRIASQSAAGALASNDVASNAITNAAADKLRFISLIASYDVEGGTSGEGPLNFGIAHSDYTAAEIEECLEAVGGINLGDKIAREQSNRLVRMIGTIDIDNAENFNDGKPVKTRLNWLMSAGDQLQLWILNKDANTISAGAVITVDGDLWVQD